jgi:PAS domain S-box-containing protein
MQRDLREKIRAATEESGITKPDFVALLKLIDQHYDKMEATITQSLQTQTQTPIEAIFDSITDACLSVAVDGTIRNCNKVCSHYFGPERKDLIGMHIGEFLPEMGKTPVAEYLKPFLSNLDDTQLDALGGEVVARRADDSTFDACINASSIETVGGDVYVVCLRDISDRKKAEIALRENEERYRALVENAPEAIIVFDADDNRFIDANDNACTLFNLSRARLLSVGPEAISPETQPDGTPSFGVRRGFIDRVMNGEHPTFEWMHQDSAGRQIPCEVRFSRLPSDDRRLIRAAITDIEERKRDEAQAHAQNKILEMIAASTPYDRTLRAICRFVEKISPGLRVAIMQVDRRNHCLSVEQAPSLDAGFRLSLDFVAVGPDSLTCGSAIHHGQDRITPDLSRDPGWKGSLGVAEKQGVKAAWSFLVYGAAGRVIGTLDVYADEAREPTTDELDKIGRLARLAGIAIKRELDEQRLRNSEARYRGLFENTVDGIYIASREGDIITANPALVEMLGYDSVEDLKAAGRTTVLYVNPIDRERVFARLEAEGYVRNFEYRLRRKDGKQIVVLENSRAIVDDDGNVIAHEGTITDITDRKRAETRVFEEKERAEVTLQSIGDGVITTDADGNIDYINPVAQDLTGWDMRSARGRPVSDIMTIVNEHTRATCENPVMRCLKEGRIITLPESSVLITRSGEEVPIQDSAAPIRDRIGNIIGSVMVFHDVSRESRLFRQLSYQASHDTLTGLLNRREFENRLVSTIRLATRRAMRYSSRFPRSSRPRFARPTCSRASVATSTASCSSAAARNERSRLPKVSAARSRAIASSGRTRSRPCAVLSALCSSPMKTRATSRDS